MGVSGGVSLTGDRSYRLCSILRFTYPKAASIGVSSAPASILQPEFFNPYDLSCQKRKDKCVKPASKCDGDMAMIVVANQVGKRIQLQTQAILRGNGDCITWINTPIPPKSDKTIVLVPNHSSSQTTTIAHIP